MLRGVWQLASIELFFHPWNILRVSRSGVSTGNKNVGCGMWKQRFLALAVRITGKLLQIDGYMLWGVWQALNCLFISATFCVIATGATPGKNINCGNLIIHNVAGLLKPTVVSNRQACSLLKNINLSRLMVKLTATPVNKFSSSACVSVHYATYATLLSLVNFLTYSYKSSCTTSTNLQTGIERFVSDSWASCISNW